jgi:hypothetical protein
MSSKIENLHTSIRRYCMERYCYWTKTYGELVSAGKDRSGSEYTKEALYTFPRYNVLDAILVEVERHRPVDFTSLDEARRVFKAVAAEAQSIFTQPPNGNVEQQAMNEEREALDNFIAKVTEDDLSLVEPLFYRRVLSADESAIIRDRLQMDWSVSQGYWYPLADRKREDIEAFQDTYFEKEVGTEKLHTIFRLHGIETLWEMREDGINFELELSVFEPYYNGYEGYWCDATFEWVIYASHESSITIGGWLLPEVKDVWSDWKERVWTTPFFDQR